MCIKKQLTWVLRILTFTGIYFSSPSAFLGSTPIIINVLFNVTHPVGPAEQVQNQLPMFLFISLTF